MKPNSQWIAWAVSALLGASMAHASDARAQLDVPAKPMPPPMSATAGQYNSIVGRAEERSQLASELRAGHNRADLDKILVRNGYRISAINEDSRDYLEYEVVRGKNSYEVQVTFGNGSTSPTQIEVERNLWRAETTEKMVDDPSYRPPGAMAADSKGRYSDKLYLRNWTDEKDQLEKALPANLKVDEYRGKLERLGYRVTAVNDRELNHLEFEIVKGVNSYEVQIDVDPTSRMARKIDVTSNLWEAEATDAATDRAERRSK